MALGRVFRALALNLLPALLPATCGCAAAGAPARNDGIPIVAWYSIPEAHSDDERYRELANAGFTISYSNFSTTATLDRALASASKAGVRLMFRLPDLLRNPEEIARRYQRHPAVAGYVLADEPSAARFPSLAELVRRLRGADADHIAYINLLPSYATASQLGAADYRTYIASFADTVQPGVLSFDHYPIVRGRSGRDTLRDDYYANIEIVADTARRRSMPFWGFCLAVPHGSYPPPTEGHLRLQAFTLLAYGARALQFFTYWTPTATGTEFGDALIGAEGNRTGTYEMVRRLSREIKTLAPTLSTLGVDSVWHTSPLPSGTRGFVPTDALVAIEGGPALLSLMSGPETAKYLFVVSRDFERPVKIGLQLASGASLEPVSGNPAQAVEKSSMQRSGQRMDIELPPGDGRLFRIRSSDTARSRGIR